MIVKKMKSFCMAVIILVMIFVVSACSISSGTKVISHNTTDTAASGSSQIYRISKHPVPQDLARVFSKEKMAELPKYDTDSLAKWRLDLRSRDISHLDLTNNLDEILHSSFDSVTKWPEKLPQGFEPRELMAYNKTPGLNIKKLHEQGTTGKGVGVGIIDYAILVDHVEYKDNLRMYEEIHYQSDSHFHGPGVSSILLGKNVGVAPDAELYFVGCENYDFTEGMTVNQTFVAQSIERLLEINKTLPKENKIRVISISGSWEPNLNGYKEMRAAIEKANKQNVFVVSCNLFEYNPEFHFRGLAREAMDNPDSFDSYKVIKWDKWMSLVSHIGEFDKYYEEKYKGIKEKKTLLIPIDSRCLADATGDENYTFYANGGWSWAIPYISGLYALCCQEDPDMTPKKFWDAAYETGIEREIDVDGQTEAGRIVNAEKLIERIKGLK